jgi:hypothetical protein
MLYFSINSELSNSAYLQGRTLQLNRKITKTKINIVKTEEKEMNDFMKKVMGFLADFWDHPWIQIQLLYLTIKLSWINSGIYKKWKKNWDDKPVYKTRIVKDGVEEDVKDKKGKKVIDSEKTVKGRNQGFTKRLGMFIFGIALAGLFCWFLISVGNNLYFRLSLCMLISWLMSKRLKSHKWWQIVSILFLLLAIIISIAYLPELKSRLILAYFWLAGIASLLFTLEELSDKNYYPKFIPLAWVAVVVVCLGFAFVGVFKPHSYYALEGSRATIVAQDKLDELKSYEVLKARFMTNNSMPSTYRKAPATLTGISSDTPEVAKTWISLFMRNHLPIEYGRIEAVFSKMFFVIFFTAFLAVFMFVAVPEMAGDIIQGYKDKTKSKGKKSGGEGLTATSYILFDIFGNIIHEFIGRKKK